MSTIDQNRIRPDAGGAPGRFALSRSYRRRKLGVRLRLSGDDLVEQCVDLRVHRLPAWIG
jgi:hypothetical protein